MESTLFVLDEKFCTEDEEQHKRQFQKLFEQYIVDSLFLTNARKQ